MKPTDKIVNESSSSSSTDVEKRDKVIDDDVDVSNNGVDNVSLVYPSVFPDTFSTSSFAQLNGYNNKMESSSSSTVESTTLNAFYNNGGYFNSDRRHDDDNSIPGKKKDENVEFSAAVYENPVKVRRTSIHVADSRSDNSDNNDDGFKTENFYNLLVKSKNGMVQDDFIVESESKVTFDRGGNDPDPYKYKYLGTSTTPTLDDYLGDQKYFNAHHYSLPPPFKPVPIRKLDAQVRHCTNNFFLYLDKRKIIYQKNYLDKNTVNLG